MQLNYILLGDPPQVGRIDAAQSDDIIALREKECGRHGKQRVTSNPAIHALAGTLAPFSGGMIFTHTSRISLYFSMR